MRRARDCRAGGASRPASASARWPPAGGDRAAGLLRAGHAWQSPGAGCRSRCKGCCSGKRGGPRRGIARLVNLSPLPCNPPPGRLSFQDARGCKPFEVHQHGEVLLYFRSPRFIPGRGSGRPGRLLRSLGLPRRTDTWPLGHWPPRRGREGAGRDGSRALAPAAPSHSRSGPARVQRRRPGKSAAAAGPARPPAARGECAGAPVRTRVSGEAEVAVAGIGGGLEAKGPG